MLNSIHQEIIYRMDTRCFSGDILAGKVKSFLSRFMEKHSVCEQCHKESMQRAGKPAKCPHCGGRRVRPKRRV